MLKLVKMSKNLALFIGLLFLVSCDNWFAQPSIKLGLVAGLSEKYAHLGTQVRNAVQLALSQANYQSGDRNIQLLVMDDRQNAEEARRAVDNLLKQDVKFIIGNVTSSMTQVTLDAIKFYPDVLLISPTASSADFSYKDDNFLRTQTALDHYRLASMAKSMAQSGIKRLMVIYDPDNQIYAKAYTQDLQAELEILGIDTTPPVVQSQSAISVQSLLETSQVDGILLVTNDVDTARWVQTLKLMGATQKLMATGWAMTPQLLQQGGAALEGLEFTASYADENTAEDFVQFKKDYQNTFHEKPSVFAAQAYETAKILIPYLHQVNNGFELKQRLLEKKVFDGLQGPIEFDKYGDVKRQDFKIVIREGKYQVVNP